MLRQSFGRGQNNNVQPDWRQYMKNANVAQVLPMGRFSKVARMAMSPQGIMQGARAFEADAAAFQLAQKKQLIQEMTRRRALAAKEQAQAAFRKVWPEGSSEQLVKNFVKNKSSFSPRQFFK